jgi:hypothetical protein
MAMASGHARAYIHATVAAFALVAWGTPGAQPKTSAPRTQHDGATPHIIAVIEHPAVARHLLEWGMSGAEVRAQVATLSLPDRARLAYLLNRRWRTDHGPPVAALQARYLVTFSLLRQSTSLAGSLTDGAAAR